MSAKANKKLLKAVAPDPDLKARELGQTVKDLRKRLGAALDRKVEDRSYADFVSRAARVTQGPPPEWTRLPRAGKLHPVVPIANLSDWHLDEQVVPAQVRNLNGFNRPIAKSRLERCFQNILELCFDYVKGFEYPGIVVPFTGDMLSGDIHEELRETNAAAMFASLIYWAPLIDAGLRLLAKHFKRVWVPLVVGNHGRNTKKPIFKNQVENNLDWLLGQILAMRLEDDPRIQFHISPSHKYLFQIFRTRFLQSHGDEAKGGSGIAGALSPLMIADHRARKTFHYDYWICGHWHQLSSFKGVRCNGAGKGYDEYALGKNFDFRWPEQDLFFVDPRYGITGAWPVHVLGKDEPWLKQCPLPIPGRSGESRPFQVPV